MSDSAAALAPRLVAEGVGTFFLVFLGIGTALFASHLADPAGAYAPGIVHLAVAAAFGLAYLASAAAFGRVSGAHLNPAVTLAVAAAGRLRWSDAGRYALVQTIGGLVATTLLVLVGLFGPVGWLETAQNGGFASAGWGARSAAGFDLPAAVIVELVLAALLALVFLGDGARHASAVGAALTAIHLVAAPVDGGLVNPATAIATAVYGGADALAQVWVFAVLPLVGALAAGLARRGAAAT